MANDKEELKRITREIDRPGLSGRSKLALARRIRFKVASLRRPSISPTRAIVHINKAQALLDEAEEDVVPGLLPSIKQEQKFLEDMAEDLIEDIIVDDIERS